VNHFDPWFLGQLGQKMDSKMLSLRYRSSFTINYRALFPDESRNYRVDILEASVEQNAVIWVSLPQ
jgi:hypothetical protein